MGRTLCILACLFVSGDAVASGLPPLVHHDAYAWRERNGVPTPNAHNDTGPDIYDAINQVLQLTPDDPGYLRTNADADRFWVGPDALWRDLEGTVALVCMTADYRNTLGVYADPGVGLDRRPVLGPYSGFGFWGDGSTENPFPATRLDLPPGSQFGWYLETDQGSMFRSEPELNPGGWDHLVAYELGPVSYHVDYGDTKVVHLRLDEAYLLAWEDMTWDGTRLGDDDYDDMVYVVGKVAVLAESGLRPMGHPPHAEPDDLARQDTVRPSFPPF